MKYYLLLILLSSTQTIASEKENTCELAFNAQIYEVAADRFPMKADSILDEIEHEGDDDVINTFVKEEVKAYQNCRKLNGSSDLCKI